MKDENLIRLGNADKKLENTHSKGLSVNEVAVSIETSHELRFKNLKRSYRRRNGPYKLCDEQHRSLEILVC